MLHTIKLLNYLGQMNWNQSHQQLLQTCSGKQACFPQIITCLMKVILEESQNNITSCLLEISLPCSRIAEEPPTTSGTNPQTITNSHSACLRKLLLSCPLTSVLFQIRLAGNKNSQQNMSITGKDLLLFWQARPTKLNLKKTEKKENRDQMKYSSKIRLQENRQSGPSDANISVIHGEHEMRRVTILWLRRLWAAQSHKKWWRKFR